jgi:hypothetical protein
MVEGVGGVLEFVAADVSRRNFLSAGSLAPTDVGGYDFLNRPGYFAASALTESTMVTACFRSAPFDWKIA